MRSISEPEATASDDPDAVAIAREIALRQLTQRSRSVAELTAALRRKNVPESAIAEVVSRFEAVGLLNDAAFAQEWVASAVRRRRSRRMILEELRAKGVAPDDIETALAGLPDDFETAAAVDLARKRAASCAGLPESVRYRRIASALTRRGFPAAVVHEAVRDALSEPEFEV